jgi:transcriptional regulator with XRE-family HTH domain
MYNKALCLRNKNDNENAHQFLRYAYFAYAMFNMPEKCDELQKTAVNYFGKELKTYGAERIAGKTPMKPEKINFGGIDAEDTIGAIIQRFRKEAGIKPADIFCCLCSQSYSSKIESGSTKNINVFLLEAIFQRLGLDPDLYFKNFLTEDDYRERHLRNEITANLAYLKYEEAGKLLNDLSERDLYKQGLGLQFLKVYEANFKQQEESAKYSFKFGTGFSNFECILLEGIKITLPHYDESKISTYRLTNQEATIINCLAMNYCETDELERGLSMFRQLIKSYDNSYTDESAKSKMYNLFLLNIATYLSYTSDYEENLNATITAQKHSIKHDRFNALPTLAGVRGLCLCNLERKEEALSWLAISYHTAGIIGEGNTQRVANEFAIELLGVDFTMQ